MLFSIFIDIYSFLDYINNSSSINEKQSNTKAILIFILIKKAI